MCKIYNSVNIALTEIQVEHREITLGCLAQILSVFMNENRAVQMKLHAPKQNVQRLVSLRIFILSKRLKYICKA